jgi:hypothetical protein
MKEQYYEIINNVKYDKQLLDKARELIAGRGDGRISEEDAYILVNAGKDGNIVTEYEKQTLQYILDNFNCTEPAVAILLPSIN